MKVQLELFTANVCSRCDDAKTLVSGIVKELDNEQLELDCVEVIENLDHAVNTGVLATPALAVNGRLVFCPLPGRKQILQFLKTELAA